MKKYCECRRHGLTCTDRCHPDPNDMQCCYNRRVDSDAEHKLEINISATEEKAIREAKSFEELHKESRKRCHELTAENAYLKHQIEILESRCSKLAEDASYYVLYYPEIAQELRRERERGEGDKIDKLLIRDIEGELRRIESSEST